MKMGKYSEEFTLSGKRKVINQGKEGSSSSFVSSSSF